MPSLPRTSVAEGRAVVPLAPTANSSPRPANDPRATAMLAAAVTTVVDEWPENDGYVLSRAAVLPVARELGEMVLSCMEGRVPSTSALSPWVSAHRLAARVRAAWVRHATEVSPPMTGPVVLAVLGAFDAVESAIEHEASQRFVGRLSGPDAARLVVELAHDMRSTMGSILFLSETIRTGRSGPVTSQQQRQLGLIYSAALGLNGMVNDVMDLARGAARLLERHPVAFQPSELISTVLTIVRPTAEEKGLELVTDIADVGTRIGHPVALSRVLLNLVSNSLKFTEVGRVRIEIGRGDGTALVVRVSDTGRGMSAATVASLYEAFRARGQNGDEYFSGAGLGLAMCQALLGRMGSRLEVESAEGRGTTFAFVIQLPYAQLL